MLSLTFGNYQKDPFTGQYYNAGNRTFSVIRSAIDENILLFDCGGFVKSVRVVDQGGGFVYQFRKKYINANGGAAGLYEFLEKESKTPGGGFFLAICNKVFNYMS